MLYNSTKFLITDQEASNQLDITLAKLLLYKNIFNQQKGILTECKSQKLSLDLLITYRKN
jgi:hypothetical protein